MSIPIFTSQLEKSRESTDLANLRAAKAAAVTAYLGEEAPIWKANAAGTGKELDTTTVLYYNSAQGKISTTGDACGKGTTTKGGCQATTFGTVTYDEDTDAAGKMIKVTCATDGSVTCEFVAATP